MIAVVALLVLGGGGAGAYFYFGKQAEASIGDTEEHQDAGEAHEKGKKGGHGDKEHETTFVELDPLILPIIDENGLSQTLNLVVVLEVTGEENAKEVERLVPRLKDAFIQDMYGVLNKRAALRDGVLQVGMIKERLGKISDKVMGEGVVDDVLLQVVQQRPI